MASKSVLVSFLCWTALASLASAEVRVTMADALKSAAPSNPQPEYNPLAKKARIAGEVIVEVKINEKGEVSDVQTVSGNPVLSNPVLKTLKMWKFKPFQAEGKPTAAVTNLRFAFKN